MTLLRRFSGGIGREPHKNGIYQKKFMKLSLKRKMDTVLERRAWSAAWVGLE
jgi:hypothetical protein